MLIPLSNKTLNPADDPFLFSEDEKESFVKPFDSFSLSLILLRQ